MKYTHLPGIILALLLLSLSSGIASADAEPLPASMQDTLGVKAFMNMLHGSMADGDSVAVASFLSDEVTIAEGGRVQSREEYLSHHLPGDAAFLSSMTREPLSFSVRALGSAVVVVSTSRLSGTYRDREIDMISVETAVLQRSPGGLKVVSLHWSSGKR